jgi:hypothetical protein
MDPATKLILGEIGKLGIKLINGKGTKIIITPEDFQRFWTKVGEFTSSLMLGIHYNHYKATIQCNISTRILAQQLTVVARSGIPPESWSIGLQVMLEKIAGVCLVEKLQAIQLSEANFNCYNQFIFGKAVMDSLNSIGYTPEELFSQKREYKQRREVQQDTHGRSFLTGPPPNDSGFSRCRILLGQSKPHYHITSMAGPHKRKYSSNSCFSNMPANH